MTDKAQKAQMLYDAGLYRQADALVREAIAECPANAECFRLMSYVDLQLNRRTQAVQSARTAVSLAPDDYEVYVCLAFALYRSYQFEEAMHAAETALELCPDYAYGMAVASSIKQSLNDKEGALQYAELGLAIDPDCDSCLKRKAFALRSLNRIAEAEAVEKNCLELDPNDMFNHISRGFGAARSEDLDGMFEHFENALRLEPDNPTAHYAMACGFLREGNFAKAEEHARNAYQSDVDDVDAALLLADVLVSSHQVTKALEILELALKKYPEHEGLHVKICEIALDTLYWNLAESTARHLLKLHNNHFVAIFTLMRCCQSYGKVQEIDTLLERFLKDNTDTEEAYHLRILREHIRGDALALEQIAQEGLVLYPDDDYIKEQLVLALVQLKKYQPAYELVTSIGTEIGAFKRVQLLVAIDSAQKQFDRGVKRLEQAAESAASKEQYFTLIKSLVTEKWLRSERAYLFFYKGLQKGIAKFVRAPRDPIPKMFSWCDSLLYLFVAGNACLIIRLLSSVALVLDPAGRRYFNRRDLVPICFAGGILGIQSLIAVFHQQIWHLLSGINYLLLLYYGFLVLLCIFVCFAASQRKYRSIAFVFGSILFALLYSEWLRWFYPRH